MWQSFILGTKMRSTSKTPTWNNQAISNYYKCTDCSDTAGELYTVDVKLIIFMIKSVNCSGGMRQDIVWWDHLSQLHVIPFVNWHKHQQKTSYW